jgi:hypothetical protein
MRALNLDEIRIECVCRSDVTLVWIIESPINVEFWSVNNFSHSLNMVLGFSRITLEFSARVWKSAVFFRGCQDIVQWYNRPEPACICKFNSEHNLVV